MVVENKTSAFFPLTGPRNKNEGRIQLLSVPFSLGHVLTALRRHKMTVRSVRFMNALDCVSEKKRGMIRGQKALKH